MITVPPTHNSIFDRIRQGGEVARQAHAEWFAAYRSAIQKFLFTKGFRAQADIDDFAQDFVVKKALDGPLLTNYFPEPGRQFRARLFTALQNYCTDIRRSRTRANNRAGGAHVSLQEAIDQPDVPGPDVFEVLWVRQTIGRAIRRMKRECEHSPLVTKRHAWQVLREIILALRRGNKRIPYADIVKKYMLPSLSEAHNAAADGRTYFRDWLKAVVSEYAGADDAEAELEDLWSIIRDMNRVANRRNRLARPKSPEKE